MVRYWNVKFRLMSPSRPVRNGQQPSYPQPVPVQTISMNF